MTKDNPGYKIEKQMMNWFKGKPHSWECVDFQTSSSLYEIKSCKFLLNCNPERKHQTTQLGRFFVKVDNHKLLKEVSENENKVPRYVFAIVIGNQKVWKTMKWKEVDKLLDLNKKVSSLRIHEVFKKELGLK